jgi:hypothetical protein
VLGGIIDLPSVSVSVAGCSIAAPSNGAQWRYAHPRSSPDSSARLVVVLHDIGMQLAVTGVHHAHQALPCHRRWEVTPMTLVRRRSDHPDSRSDAAVPGARRALRVGRGVVKRWRGFAPGMLITLGAVLRLRQYFANRSLWLDESLLALNVVERSFAQLLQPLDHVQAAPFGFVAMERLAVIFFGASEYALRLFPLLCGIGSLFLFWNLVRELLSPLSALLALAIFAISEHLIYYAVEVKPYSTDVAVALLLWWAFGRWERDVSAARRVLLLAGMLGAAAVWFSYPAVLVLGGLGSRWLARPVGDRQWPILVSRAAVSLIWVLSFIAAYVLTMHGIGTNPELREAWRPAAAPLLPRSLADVNWYVEAVATVSSLPLGRAVDGLVILTATIGAVARRDLVGWLAGPLILSWLASGLERYPLAARLWLFITPFIITLVATGLADTWSRTRKTAPMLAPILLLLIFAYPTLSVIHEVIRPRQVEEVRPLLDHARKEYQHGDVLYLYYWTEFPARYYTALGRGFPGEVIVGVVGGTESVGEYERDIQRLQGRRRVWLLFSHVQSPHGVNEQTLLVRNLAGIGRELAAHHLPGASLYLYEVFRQAPP